MNPGPLAPEATTLTAKPWLLSQAYLDMNSLQRENLELVLPVWHELQELVAAFVQLDGVEVLALEVERAVEDHRLAQGRRRR